MTAAILLISFTVFTLVFTAFSRSRWIQEKNDLLYKNVQVVAGIAGGSTSNPTYLEEQLTVNIEGLARIMGGDIFLVNRDGSTEICSHSAYEIISGKCNHQNYTVPQVVMKQVAKGDYSGVGKMGGLYGEDRYCLGVPVVIQGQTVGAVFATVPAADLNGHLLKIVQLLLVCSLIVLVFAFLAIYVMTAQMTRPLRMMADAAREMEQGNFLKRIPVDRQDEIGQLAEAFNKMSVSLASLEQMRRSFISSVSHELKTPMTTISGFIDGVLDGTIPPEQQDRYLRIVSDETRRLSRLVNSMLQLSRLEQDRVELHPSSFNITEVILQVFFSFETRVEDKRLNIQGLDEAGKIMLCADRDLIYQVIYNLVENAIKFTPEEGTIRIGVSESKHGKVHVYIQNSGQGLTQQELSHIFERFYKTDRSRSEDKSGMGFGLYIVKMIVALHGGSITASSVYGEYTRFDLELENLVVNHRVESGTPPKA